MLKIRKSLLNLEKGSYADDNAEMPEGAVDCTQGSNPYGMAPGVKEVCENADDTAIYAYPHGQEVYAEIMNLWRDYTPLSRGQIFLCDGSIGGIYAINNIFEEPNAKVVGIAPQFTDYVENIRTRGMEYRHVELEIGEDFAFNAERVINEITNEDSLLYIDEPNNPTGQCVSLDDMKKILDDAKAKGVCVIFDEAYGDFVPQDESAVRFLGEYDNLVVIRTFSKGYGMAGLRAGYVLSSEEIIAHINKMSNPYNMGEISREMAAEALRHSDFTLSHMDDFIESKQMLREVTGKNVKMSVSDDRVPICLLYHADHNMNLAAELAKNGVITVDCSDFDCVGPWAVRLRMPIKEQMPKVVAAVKAVNEG